MSFLNSNKAEKNSISVVHMNVRYRFCFLQDTVTYSLKGTELDRRHFYLNPDDGVLTLRKSLLSSSAMQFQVRLTNSVVFHVTILLVVKIIRHHKTNLGTLCCAVTMTN